MAWTRQPQDNHKTAERQPQDKIRQDKTRQRNHETIPNAAQSPDKTSHNDSRSFQPITRSDNIAGHTILKTRQSHDNTLYSKDQDNQSLDKAQDQTIIRQGSHKTGRQEDTKMTRQERHQARQS